MCGGLRMAAQVHVSRLANTRLHCVMPLPCQHALLQPPVVGPGLHSPRLLTLLHLPFTAAAAAAGGVPRAPPASLPLLLLLMAIVPPPAPAAPRTLCWTPVQAHASNSVSSLPESLDAFHFTSLSGQSN
jgi:hypothetical protein